MAQANIDLPVGALEHLFGGDRDPQEVADERFWFAHELRPSTYWRPDLSALKDGPVRIVAGIGAQSAGQQCERTTTALAAAIGVEPTRFPGDHIGMVEQPEPFAGRLRDILAGR